MNDIGSVARVRSPQAVALLTDSGSPTIPFQSVRLTSEVPFLVEGELDKSLIIRLLSGKHKHRLAAISRQDLDVVQQRPASILVA